MCTSSSKKIRNRHRGKQRGTNGTHLEGKIEYDKHVTTCYVVNMNQIFKGRSCLYRYTHLRTEQREQAYHPQIFFLTLFPCYKSIRIPTICTWETTHASHIQQTKNAQPALLICTHINIRIVFLQPQFLRSAANAKIRNPLERRQLMLVHCPDPPVASSAIRIARD